MMVGMAIALLMVVFCSYINIGKGEHQEKTTIKS